MSIAQWKMDSTVGPLYLLASTTGLKGIFWKKLSPPLVTSLKSTAPEIKILAQTVQQVEEYLCGKRKDFNLPLEMDGTPFQKKVWQRLSQIPYGNTRSYKDIAHEIKNAKAVRAVGAANGRNPLSIIVPCHRVIASDGSLGGYAGGLDIKIRLLELEKNTCASAHR